MAVLTFQEAAHRLRMTPKLLRSFATYAPRRDGRKLAFDAEGRIEEADLLSFDAHIRADWGGSYVPAGVEAELDREATGRCALCPSTHTLEKAHIHRKAVECDYYWQHPHNLILLCGTCHGRYDSKTDKHITHDVVLHRKEALQAQLLVAVDTEIRIATMIESVIAPKRSFIQREGSSFWLGSDGSEILDRLAQASGSVGALATQQGEPHDRLQHLSYSLGEVSPLAAAKLSSLEVEGLGTDAEAWRELDQSPWLCARGDGAIALVEGAVCPECGDEDHSKWNEEPVGVEAETFPVAYFEDARGDHYTPDCPSCGHSPMEWTFQSLCGYCEHMTSKDD